uniref:Ig-like domain-containing protein n=1 Tax=Denticeps clupeoides TaxID=299321 RepID=A0AAY4ACN1_9TELE
PGTQNACIFYTCIFTKRQRETIFQKRYKNMRRILNFSDMKHRAMPYLYWYQQNSSGLPTYILQRVSKSGSNDKNFEKRFNASIISTRVPLTIQSLQVSDSAVYYCMSSLTSSTSH